ncbi:penicillin acylase family protein [Paucibacter sp. PLA-PC-4]|uniref:penicillin acylase family protein n=1 Tax=Paucibacter sp. PLA-PC-4 TaxID=2993655 RepID=UPI00224959A8|nr:penicillin acylase family protein [Paucibacter sp. PLA-PC-4]MCX2863242.1 penicillin acylase family protein [Paucibacter sp. PLA-PC-4]
MRWLRRLLLGLLALVLLIALAAWLALRSSLPSYEGEARSAVSAAVALTRDERGYLSISATNRADAARALGYSHAQERFFQMDLMRRNAAGELSALFGAKALPLDQGRRLHRFRYRAAVALAALPAEHRNLLDAYAAGVNEGLTALGARPFEYLLLRQAPRPWQAADSLLVIYSMYLDLQSSQGRDDLAMGVLKGSVPPDWYAFLTQHSSDWQAAIDGSRVQALAVPATPLPDALRTAKLACVGDCGLQDSRDIGSNNFAVSGSLSPHGAAILADDMHLGLRVPAIWFKAQLRWTEAGRSHQVSGVSLPGTPAIVAGSNGAIAWGFTNATADWADVVRLRLNAAGTHYQSPQGELPVTRHIERIEVAGGETVEHTVHETIWGPRLAPPFAEHVLRWVAHDVEGLNLRLLGLERAGSVAEAMQAARGAGLPAQNLLVADASGRIGWTLIGALPVRQLDDLNLPQDWSDGRQGWRGYLSAADPAWPQVVNPSEGRLWTANARTVGGTALALIGEGGYDLGARGQQIRDALFAKAQLGEADLHDIQLDHRALFLQRWRRVLLDEVLTPAFVQQHGLADYRAAIEHSAAAASPDAVGYRLLRAWRERVLEQLFAPLAGLLESRQLRLRDLKLAPETPGWALLQARRADTLPQAQASWRALLEQGVLDSRKQILEATPSRQLADANWGEHNRAAIKHPLSQALPLLGPWLDMPDTPLAGDRHMPRVQQSVHGQSQRMVVAPGQEARGILSVPAGQSGHPLSPFYRADHQAWLQGQALPFLPGEARYTLILRR